jgi:hypothetical protein
MSWHRPALVILTCVSGSLAPGCSGHDKANPDAGSQPTGGSDPASTTVNGGAGGTTAEATGGAGGISAGTTGSDPGGSPFSFIVFGDLNGGGCDRNARAKRIVDRIAQESDVAFTVQMGDLIDGYVDSDSNTSTCFANDPAKAAKLSACSNGVVGNMAELLKPLKTRPARPGLPSWYFQVIGNHDDGWGDDWYPDPCGDGICQSLAPLAPSQFINHPLGDICALSQNASSFSQDFYYSFAYQGSTFIVLSLNNDEDNMIAS